jgi:hypothetical protein
LKVTALVLLIAMHCVGGGAGDRDQAELVTGIQGGDERRGR